MNRYISKSYTTSKNTIDRQYKERGQLQCQLLLVFNSSLANGIFPRNPGGIIYLRKAEEAIQTIISKIFERIIYNQLFAILYRIIIFCLNTNLDSVRFIQQLHPYWRQPIVGPIILIQAMLTLLFFLTLRKLLTQSTTILTLLSKLQDRLMGICRNNIRHTFFKYEGKLLVRSSYISRQNDFQTYLIRTI